MNDEAKADTVLNLLARAIAELHSDRRLDPLDAALDAQPRLSTLNLIMGKENPSERFDAVQFNALVERISMLEKAGLFGKVVTAVGDDGVLVSLLAAAGHEKHGILKKGEVRRQAEALLTYLGGKRWPTPDDRHRFRGAT